MESKSLAAVILAFCVVSVEAASPLPSPTPTLGEQIDSGDSTQIQQAVSTILDLLHAPTHHERRVAVVQLTQGDHLLRKLRKAQRYDEVVHLAVEGILALPSDVRLVDYLETYRVRALLKLGRPQEALSAAKERFNLCRMSGTASSLELVVDCLKVAYSNDDTIVDRFAEEQMAGAGLTDEHSTSNIELRRQHASRRSTSNAAGQLTAIGLRSSVLDGIKIDGSIYREAIERYKKGTDYLSLVSLGNLLLLSDRTKEAHKVFERAYAMASEKDLAAASENIARCIKAEDGTIGCANAWVMSIRP